MSLDPLTTPWRHWIFAERCTSDGCLVCCGAAEFAHHCADCPNTPMFARMVKDTNDNPLAPTFWPLLPLYWPWPRTWPR